MTKAFKGRTNFKEILPSKIYGDQISAIESTPQGVLHARFPLSGLTGSAPAALGTNASMIHQSSKTAFDEIYLWAANVNASDRILTCSIGDSSFSANTFIVTISGQEGLTLVYPGVPHSSQKI